MRLPFFVLPAALRARGVRPACACGRAALSRQHEAVPDAGGAPLGTGEAAQFRERVAELGDRVSEPLRLRTRIGWRLACRCGQSRAPCPLDALELGLQRHEHTEARSWASARTIGSWR